MKLRPALFLDRDGVINPDVGYPHLLQHAVLFDDVTPALYRIQQAGYVLLIVSNQSGVSRGMFCLDAVHRFNGAIAKKLRQGGIRVTSKNFFICPHGPQDRCVCRKPRPGLLLEAARQHKIALPVSFTVGDSLSDLEAGRRAGTYTILLNRIGKPRRKTGADYVVSSLIEVADLLPVPHSISLSDARATL